MESPFIHNTIIDGRAFANKLLENTKEDVKRLSAPPCLAVVLVGNHGPSQVYVAHKRRACALVGIESRLLELGEEATEAELIEAIQGLNNDPAVHGILLQLPLPHHIDRFRAVESIDPHKDVDGLTSANLGLLFAGRPRFIPCTPLGCLTLLKEITPLRGKKVTVVGRSLLVGRTLANLLTANDATVTLAHRHTSNLKDATQDADILIVAVGKPGLITRDYVKPGAIVLDVGITRLGEKIVGDVDFENVKNIASAITPVPGGIGPLTIASLMMNTVRAAGLCH